MTICIRCLSENNDDNKYCSHCGAKIVDPSTEEYHIALAKFKSHQVIREREKISNDKEPMRSLRYLMIEREPSFKNYPGLQLATFILFALGFTLIMGGVIGIVWTYTNSAAHQTVNQEQSNNQLIPLQQAATTASNWIRYGISFALILIGFGMIVNAETTKLFMDLQENADRQSIALHAIFQVLLKNKRDDE